MSDIAIRVEGLGKQYRIGTGPRYGTLRDALASLTQLPGRLLRRNGSTDGDDRFWALKDVSFEVKRGEVVGIIGRNGAGKSTLLKILSRITEPTEGGADIFGRVGSLLEVGTGFHAELTGRENIFLNGAILGMRRAEILKKFDEIVAFAEVEKFIDTPVKHYSSGMYMRLAFAVAAHLEPEILIVDEVLAVGDAEFQKKCLGKMGEVARHGRTVLFVSHNMAAVYSLCSRGLVLHRGNVIYSGPADAAVNHYMDSVKTTNIESSNQGDTLDTWRITRANSTKATFDPAEPKEIDFHIDPGGAASERVFVRGILMNEQAEEIAQFESRLLGIWLRHESRARVRITSPWLKPGRYYVNLFVCGRSAILACLERACEFNISPALPYPDAMHPESTKHGLVLADFEWETDDRSCVDDLER